MTLPIAPSRFSPPRPGAPFDDRGARLALPAVVPFMGRAPALAALSEAAQGARLVVVRGAEGVGKTRLAVELCADPRAASATRCAHVRVDPNDRWACVTARAERALGACPGGLASVLATQPVCLILDDAHNLGADARQAARALAGRGAGRIVALSTEPLPATASAVARADIALEGLGESAAAALWSHLDRPVGAAEEGAFARAMARTRGYPRALVREHAMARFGSDAWDAEALPEAARRALAALAVLRQPVTPAAVEVLDPEIGDGYAALAELAHRHLIEAHLVPSPSGRGAEPDGRVAVPAPARASALSVLTEGARRDLERAAAEFWAVAGGPEDIEPVDRLRDMARHYLAAGDDDQAAEILAAGWEGALRRGGAPEIEALIGEVEARGAGRAEFSSARAVIAARAGRVAEAATAAEEGGGAGASARPVDVAILNIRLGETDAGARALAELGRAESADVRARSAAALAELAIARGHPAQAREIAGEAFTRDRGLFSAPARACLHRALAAVEVRAGRFSSARANLARARGAAGGEPAEEARVALGLARCLIAEGRLREADEAAGEASRAAAELGDVTLGQEARILSAVVAARRGDRAGAERVFDAQLAARRAAGDEVGALEAEILLAEIARERGDLARAQELARAGRRGALSLGQGELAGRAELALAAALAEAAPGEAARAAIARTEADISDEAIARRAREHAALAAARAGDAEAAGAIADEVEAALAATEAALARGARDDAEAAARAALLAAERHQRADEATEALAALARLALARGDRERAASRAHRALARARERGLPRAGATALLCSSALAQGAGDADEAARLARAAADTARQAGLPALGAAAARALEVLAGGGAEPPASARSEPALGAEGERRGGAEIELEIAADGSAFAEALTADLGLTVERPYRLVFGAGESHRVADARTERLDLAGRELAVDALHHDIWRGGARVADLRRRTLLRRILYLLCTRPGRAFSKEEIVEAVWEVEYHPLRHDAALFTNIMRIRRLLGDDGASIVRAEDAGYALAPPEDFLYVDAPG